MTENSEATTGSIPAKRLKMSESPEMTTDNTPLLVNIKEIQVKINEKLINYKGSVFNSLLLRKDSMIACAIEFYQNKPEKPIDLSDAPHVERFEELIQILLKQLQDKSISLRDQAKPLELLKLADYLGILPDDSLDILCLKCRLDLELKKKERNAQMDEEIQNIAKFLINYIKTMKLVNNEVKIFFIRLENYEIQIKTDQAILKTVKIPMNYEKVMRKFGSILISCIKLITNTTPIFEQNSNRYATHYYCITFNICDDF